MRVRAALSRDGIEVYGDSVMMNPKEQQEILLQVIFLVFIKNVKFSRSLFSAQNVSTKKNIISI